MFQVIFSRIFYDKAEIKARSCFYEQEKLDCFWLAALLLLFVFNGSLLITDSVESNYALTAKEMVVSGDWLSPQIYGQYWFDKPVFFTG